MSSSGSDFQYYLYTPSLAAAIVFVVVFAISTSLHLWQGIRGRTWYMIPLIIGGTCEAIGYVGRAISSHQAPNYTLSPYIVQSILILIAPALMSASIYMVLGRIVTAVDGEDLCLIKRRLLTVTFVIGDVMSFMLQSTGAGLAAKTDPDSKTAGKWIIVGGLAIQLIFFGLFIVVSINFNSRINSHPTAKSQDRTLTWRAVLYVLYAADILIMVRSVFRVAEYVQGTNGYLLRRELWLYIFDATLMAVVMLVLNGVHPRRLMRFENGERETELQAATAAVAA